MNEPYWNDLFLKWLEEMTQQMNSSSTGASHKQAIYTRALHSLTTATEKEGKKYTHASQLIELKYFGEKICRTLEGRAKRYCEENGLPPPSSLAAPVSIIDNGRRCNSPVESQDNEGDDRSLKKKRKTSTKAYIPRLGSGGYALLIVMGMHESDPDFRDGMTKTDLIRLATPHCSSSFSSNHSTGTYYSAWTSMNQLQKKELVDCVSGRLPKYFLTETGREIATKLIQAASPFRKSSGATNSQYSVIATGSPPSKPGARTASSPTISLSGLSKLPNIYHSHSAIQLGQPCSQYLHQIAHSIHLPSDPQLASMSENGATTTHSVSSQVKIKKWGPDTYEIQLIIDNREVRSKLSRDFFPNEMLAKHSIQVLTEPLPVGDALWVAVNKQTGQRAVLNYIIERKRLDDLVSSIKDGRYTEQKHRLQKSGLEHVIYLLEKPQFMTAGQFTQGVQTAVSRSILFNNFYRCQTDSSEATAEYFAQVNKFITSSLWQRSINVISPDADDYSRSLHNAKQLVGDVTAIDWNTFVAVMSKSGTLTIKDLFIKMLRTIRGVTAEKAVVIQGYYATPRALVEKYQSIVTTAKKMSHFADLTVKEIASRKIGRVVSERIYECWGK